MPSSRPPAEVPRTSATRAGDVKIHVHRSGVLDAERLKTLQTTLPNNGALSSDLRWLTVLQQGLGHEPLLIEAVENGKTTGLLPLALVRSLLFGRFLVSLPYLNSGGVRTANPQAATRMIDRAAELADELKVKHLELRHEQSWEHPALSQSLTSKVHMRLALPASCEALRDSIKAKVRNQVRKGEKQDFQVCWGGGELLPDFYDVFSRNMRDLGTPVFGRALFSSILRHFPQGAELCVLRHDGQPAAAALLLHGETTTEVPSASCLRAFNPQNANMLMYWHLLQRSVERGQRCFDFGRSTVDAGTYRFKKQWGAEPAPAVWQYHVREGDVSDMRPESSRYQRAIQIWQRLPLSVTRMLGPMIVRGIP